MTIGILGAMQEEISPLLEYYKLMKRLNLEEIPFIKFLCLIKHSLLLSVAYASLIQV